MDKLFKRKILSIVFSLFIHAMSYRPEDDPMNGPKRVVNPMIW